jgi:uncharacterized membrane protein
LAKWIKNNKLLALFIFIGILGLSNFINNIIVAWNFPSEEWESYMLGGGLWFMILLMPLLIFGAAHALTEALRK